MSSPEEGTPVHSFQDDIKYQIIKQNFKRTPFVSSDNQITAKSKTALRAIEKNEKMVNAEFRRQHSVLVSKLETLQEKKQELGLSPRRRSESSLSSRRNSAPLSLETGGRVTLKHPSLSQSASPPSDPKSDSFINDSFVFASSDRLHDSGGDSGPLSSRVESPDHAHPPPLIRSQTSFREARRMSQEIHEQTCKMALKKFDVIMSGRRATVAAGATPLQLLPPQPAHPRRNSFNRKYNFDLTQPH